MKFKQTALKPSCSVLPAVGAALCALGLIFACSESSDDGGAGGSGGVPSVDSGGTAGSSGGASGGAGNLGGRASGEGGEGGAQSSGGAGGSTDAGTWGPITLVQRPITSFGADVSVSCEEGQVAVSGGCDCGSDGGVARSVRTATDTWTCACAQEPPSGSPTASVLCSSRSAEVTVVSTPITMAMVRFFAVCPRGFEVLSGSVSCGDEGDHVILETFAGFSVVMDPSPQQRSSWTGVCATLPVGGAGNPRLEAYCVEADLSHGSDSAPDALELEISCSPEDRVLLAGGCNCPNGEEETRLLKTTPVWTDSRIQWACGCSEGSLYARGSVVCE